MSIEAINWALKVKTGFPSRKVVLLTLANYANENGLCWPSHKLIAKQTDQSAKTVKRCIDQLVETGLILRGPFYRPDGSRSTDRLVLLVDDACRDFGTTYIADLQRRFAKPTKDCAPGDTESSHINKDFSDSRVTPPPTPVSPAPLTQVSGQEPSSEPSMDPTPRQAAREAAEKRFEDFWKRFPKSTAGKSPKAPAKKYYLDLVLKKRIDPDLIDRAAAAYADDLKRSRKIDTQFVAFARTWLSEQRFGDYDDQESVVSVPVKMPVEPADDARWVSVKAKVMSAIGEAKYASWIAPLRFSSLSPDGRVTLCAPTQFAENYIRSNFESQISAAWAQFADASGFKFIGVQIVSDQQSRAA